MFGGFPGRYAVLPFYVKIQEYNNFESRDLWEYELLLSPDEMQWLVLHLWELRPTSFDYYFFQENCSYQMLTLIEAAKPELELTSQFVFHVIPADTVKVLRNLTGLLSEPVFRASALRQFSTCATGADTP